MCARERESRSVWWWCWVSTWVLDIGWLRSVESMKLQISFAEYRLFNRALLQKRPIILSILRTKATPYQSGIEFQEVMMLDIFEQRGQNIHFQIKVPLWNPTLSFKESLWTQCRDFIHIYVGFSSLIWANRPHTRSTRPLLKEWRQSSSSCARVRGRVRENVRKSERESERECARDILMSKWDTLKCAHDTLISNRCYFACVDFSLSLSRSIKVHDLRRFAFQEACHAVYASYIQILSIQSIWGGEFCLPWIWQELMTVC